ncbi:hypothetical protein [Tsukamurella sp. PLM1]|uniref:DUF7373 family lipoprotein n=1 Tax=Tsukamurella sp. PLM1 TaxID=2929795 RepID=UPI002047423D|nr:hypothetical protein [Tsukamurella sp. PLM1]BDH56012.1 hypothetical protein MTP03_09510 [Tsukamurella sp. PLM1]
MNRAALALVACAVAVTACSTTVSGVATDSAGNSPGPVVPVGLDFGQYPTTTREVPPPSTENAWVIEGNRMAEALIQVNEVDPRLTIGGAGLRSYPVLRGSQLNSRVPDATAEAFTRNEMRVGMTTTRGDAFDEPTVAMRIGLYRFDSPEVAAKALAAVEAGAGSLRRVVGIDRVFATEFKPGTVDSYRVEGPFVINVSGTAPTTAEATRFVSKAYELEVPKVKSFTPTPVAAIQTLPGDKDGVLARTLYEDSSPLVQSLSNSYYGLTMLLHKIRDIDNGELYRKAGVDLVGEGAAIIYRTRSSSAAQTLLDDLEKTKATTNRRPAAGPAGITTVSCTEYTGDDTYFGCSGRAGRWMFTLSADTLTEAQHKVAAQYAILVTNP